MNRVQKVVMAVIAAATWGNFAGQSDHPSHIMVKGVLLLIVAVLAGLLLSVLPTRKHWSVSGWRLPFHHPRP